MTYLSALVLAMFTTIALIPLLRDLAGKYLALDMPGERKIHKRPIPKSGGIAMILGALVPILLWAPKGSSFIVSILIGSWIIIIFGVIDDMKDLPYSAKFLGQLSAALVVVFYGGLKITYLGDLLPGVSPLHTMAAIPLTVLVIVGVTNAINLSDGLDGLAGGLSLLVFICIGYLAFLDANRGIILVCTTMIGAILGFLRYNTYPASIFMGDAGSQLLGFLAVTLSLNLTQNNPQLTPLLPLLIMGLPIMDTLRVMGDRILDGKMPFKADTRHLHHRLMKLGLYHSETVLIIYCLQAMLITFAFVFRYSSDWFLLLTYALFSFAIIMGLSTSEKFGWRREKYANIGDPLKNGVRSFKHYDALIKVFFKLIEIGAPLLFLITCLIPSNIPFFVAITATILGCIFLAVRVFSPRWTSVALKLAIYIQAPLIIYQGEIDAAAWFSPHLLRPYNVLFALLAFGAVLVLKFTKRKEGFKSTPMDFLIIFVALIIPNIPDAQIRSYQIGLIAAKIISIYYGYEVLIGELREDFKRLSYVTTITLLLICSRGFLGV
jgi:UDP-GlcNAc:undecaprenyl-phosphate GlcNAc-1-phosphate transferase